MIPKECKRLAEVDFPIDDVSRHAVHEKRIHYGHPSTLHTWWARRPLASSRAMLMALLLPDPCDSNCPEEFKTAARKILQQFVGRHNETDAGIQQGLLDFIANFANWENSMNQAWLNAGQALIKAAYEEEVPLVVDPFAGGGSIPLEAIRLGCEAFASDLNPVSCLILKVMMEEIPRHGVELADKLRKAGTDIKMQAERALSDIYPPDSDGAKPVAYLWARTVRCEAPDCGAEIPLLRSFWLCNKPKRKWALRPYVKRVDGLSPQVGFEVFEPKNSEDVHTGTVTRAKATCLCCGAVLPPERVRTQLASEHGGADVKFDDEGNRIGGAMMTAVVTIQPNCQGRQYRLPVSTDYVAVRKANKRVIRILEEWEREGKQDICPIPDEPLPPIGTLGFRVQRYGMLQWGDLFNARQKSSLVELGRLTNSYSEKDVRTLMAMAVNRCVVYNNTGTRWNLEGESVSQTFARQALPIVWDFAEPVPMGNASGSFNGAIKWVCRVVEIWSSSGIGQTQQADATEHPLPDQTADVWFTDPPYYDAVPYADLSDFFLVWLKRSLRDHPILQNSFEPNNPLSPKQHEVVQDKTKKANGISKDRAWFEETMANAFAEGRRVLTENGIGSVVFAHKTTEGWEAILSGMIRGGWTITGSWPIATEMASRLRAIDSAALATSVHLVCRPRPENAQTGEWADVLRELPLRVAGWMNRLQKENIRGADLVFACIGPALEIFSTYQAVETAEGREIELSEYLEKVWEVVGRTALEQVLGVEETAMRNGMAGVLEEDARLTALFLWTLQSSGELQGSAQNESVHLLDESMLSDDGSLPPPTCRSYQVLTTKKSPRQLQRASFFHLMLFGASLNPWVLTLIIGRDELLRKKKVSCVCYPFQNGQKRYSEQVNVLLVQWIGLKSTEKTTLSKLFFLI